jgi:phosphoglycerate dehydrogenase-like enzyme
LCSTGTELDDAGVKVVVIAPMTAERAAELARVDRSVEVVDAWELFAPELVADWPGHTVDWYLPAGWRDWRDSDEQRQRRDALLGQADAICITFPFPTRLRARAPRVRLVHQLPAGVSNLRAGDLWQSGVPVTSGRGAGNTLAIAEWAIAATLALFKQYPAAFAQRQVGQLSRRAFRPRQLAGKTLGVVGLGGIGRQVARLASGLGMHVIGSRRSSHEPVPHVERLYPPSNLLELLGQSDGVVLATQLTPETDRLVDARALAAMRPGAVLINVARGELIDEPALLAALRTGGLGGFAADVYVGEFEHQPPAELLALDNVLVTPHTSGMTDQASGEAWAILCENLRRVLAGEPLLNQVDWARGY